MADAGKAGSGVFLIGGAGYFGARLAEVLCSDRPVTVTWRSRPTARASWLEQTRISAASFDSSCDSDLPLDKQVGALINLAMPGAKEASTDPEAARTRAFKTIDAALRLLDEGRTARMIHFSTFHVYGDAGAPEYHEDKALQPLHPYGQIHALVEERIAAHSCADRVTVLRPTNMVGAPAHASLGDQAGLIFLDLCQQAATRQMTLRNDGGSYRDVLAFPDAIAAVRLLLDTPEAVGATMNLAAGEAVSLHTLAQAIAERATAKVAYGDGVDAYREPFKVCIKRLKARGWAPSNMLEEEISRTIAFFR